MTTFMKESRISVTGPAGAFCGGLRISQWHKLCWSHAGITLAGTTGQLSLSRIFPGFLYFESPWYNRTGWLGVKHQLTYLYFEIRSHDLLWRWAVSCSFQISFLSVVVLPVWFLLLCAIICGHSVCKCLQVDMQAGTDARMRPSFKLKETAWVWMFRKGGGKISDFVHHNIPMRQ